MKSDSSLIFNNAAELEVALANDDVAPMIVLRFDRVEIKANTINDVLDRLCVLSNSGDAVRRMASSAMLEIEGYDTDPRELYEIPECRQFFAKLANEWKGWLHFLEKDGDTVGTFFAFLADLKTEQRNEKTTFFHFRDLDQLENVMKRQFEHMNELYLQHGLSDDECRIMTTKVTAAIKAMVAPYQRLT